MTTLLFVEDNELLVKFVTRHLNMALPEIEVVWAASCDQARKQAKERHVDLVMLDRKLPDGDGLALMADLRRVDTKVRGILATGQASLDKQESLQISGIVEVLHKPFETEQMLETIQRVLGQSHDSHDSHDGDELLPKESKEVNQLITIAIDRHAVANRLTSLLVGLRAFEVDLRAVAYDPDEINQMVDEYLERLIDVVLQLQQLTTPKDS